MLSCCHIFAGRSKPLIVFQGEQWGSDSTFSKLELFLLDYFRGQKADKVALKGLDHVISVSIIESKIHFRVFSITYKKSGNKVIALLDCTMHEPDDSYCKRTDPFHGSGGDRAALRPHTKEVKPTFRRNVEGRVQKA
jgi:hypothetical protein